MYGTVTEAQLGPTADMGHARGGARHEPAKIGFYSYFQASQGWSLVNLTIKKKSRKI